MVWLGPMRENHLLNPHRYDVEFPDPESRQIMLDTIEFFEARGHDRLREDYHAKVWYSDFLAFVREKKIFARLMMPPDLAAGGQSGATRWDTWRMAHFGEILGFYGLQYWYTWQVSVLGLGPLWMSKNEGLRRRAAQALDAGGIFAFGLSEKEHGADIYASDMLVAPDGAGGWKANGRKYYIGNGNRAAIVSTFGKLADTGEYVFFAADPTHKNYELVKNVVQSQSYVSEFALHDYPVTEAEILARGQEAWDAALNTVNVGKYNLGWGSIGICTHAFWEAIRHAANRKLYNMRVTDFPHVKQMFVDAYARLVAMRVFSRRASDYMRAASREDRRYLLFNPMVKMKVTTQGEDVINLLWDVVAAKGFERDTYFEEAAVAIRGLPKLEGTVHVNIALIVKFMASYFFNPKEYPEVPRRMDATHDAFLFDQGPTRGLGEVRFHDYRKVFEAWSLPNVQVFKAQVEAFRTLLAKAGPDAAQAKDIDLLLAVGEIFALVVYAQLILESAKMERLEDDVVDQIFDVLVRDCSRFATVLHGKSSLRPEQAELALKLIRRPDFDEARYQRVWQDHVLPMKDGYEMRR